MPAKHSLQSLRVRGPATFDQAIRVKGVDWPPESYVDISDVQELDARKLEKAANLSDLASAAAARTNLSLGTAATLNAPATGDASAGQLVKGNDTRLSDARAPLAHQHSAADINAGQLPDARIASAAAWHAKGEPNAAAESLLAAAFNITAANEAWQDTGLYIQLPAAGTYLVLFSVRGSVKMSAGVTGYVVARLFNSTDGAAVANSEAMVALVETLNQAVQQTAAVAVVVTVAAAKTIQLQALRGGNAPTFTSSQIASNNNGRTRLSFLKVL